MSLLLDKWVCGNCLLNRSGQCCVDNIRTSSTKWGCSRIEENFIDRGYYPNIRTNPLNWDEVNAKLEPALKESRTIFLQIDTKIIKELIKEKRDGKDYIGTDIYKYWNKGKKKWNLPAKED